MLEINTLQHSPVFSNRLQLLLEFSFKLKSFYCSQSNNGRLWICSCLDIARFININVSKYTSHIGASNKRRRLLGWGPSTALDRWLAHFVLDSSFDGLKANSSDFFFLATDLFRRHVLSHPNRQVYWRLGRW